MGRSKRQHRLIKAKKKAAPAPKKIAARAFSCVAPVTIRAAENEPAGVKRFDMVAYTGGPMDVEGYDAPIVVDLPTLRSAQRLPILFDHMDYPEAVVGQSERVEISNTEVKLSGLINGVGYDAEYVRAMAARGYVWQASVGARPGKVVHVPAGQQLQANGRVIDGPVNHAIDCKLREVSFVVLGADGDTTAIVSRRKKILGSVKMEFGQWLTSKGFDEASLDEVQKTNMQIMYDAEVGAMVENEEEEETGVTGSEEEETGVTGSEEEETGVTGSEEEEEETPPTNAGVKGLKIKARPAKKTHSAIQATRKALANEERRVAAIRATVKRYGVTEIKLGKHKVNLAAHAIEEGWGLEKVELEAIRASRPHAPSTLNHQGTTNMNKDILTAALMFRCAGTLPEADYNRGAWAHNIKARSMVADWMKQDINSDSRQQILEAAQKKSTMPLYDFAKEALAINGKFNHSMSREEVIQAAFSSSTFTSIFTTNVNAMMLRDYLETPDSTLGWTTTVDVMNYKQQERIRLEAGESLEPRARTEEAAHAKYSDKLETYKIASYAKKFVVDEMDIIDDSMEALQKTPKRMGVEAARLRPSLVYAILLANEALNQTGRALFNTTDGNTATGAALSIATLRSAISAMLKQTENDATLDIMPTHLIVPPDLYWLAKELLKSETLIIASGENATTLRGSMNPLASEQIEVVKEARLENGVTHPQTKTLYAGSATDWFLASTMVETIEVAYLQGTGRVPRVRTKVYDGDGKYGIAWDVEHSIGSKALDFHGIFRRQQ